MDELNGFKQRVSQMRSNEFEELALSIFKFQSKNNKIYSQYLKFLNIDSKRVVDIAQIPFLPISFFKSHVLKTLDWDEKKVFLSSGTTQMSRSRHYVEDLNFYLGHATRLFEKSLGEISNMLILALLPSYQEQDGSSLITMVDHFMARSLKGSGYFLDDYSSLQHQIKIALEKETTVVLFGVGYALLDFASQCQAELDGLHVIETGGMKGRREELTKDEFYEILKNRLGQIRISSEYGMTELLSQAYSTEDGLFEAPDCMRVLIRDIHDPFSILPDNKTGVVNVIDLANVHSCAFIETQDLGKSDQSGKFKILGRLDNSDVRGCNLMVS